MRNIVGSSAFNEIVDELFGTSYFSPFYRKTNYSIAEDDKQFLCKVILPGIKKEEISVSIENNNMTIKAKNETIGTYHFDEMCQGYDFDNIDAKLDLGILEIKVKKFEKKTGNKINKVQIK